jgi:hypothetical protein
MARWNSPPRTTVPPDLIGVPHLRTLWERMQPRHAGDSHEPDALTWARDVIVLRGLDVGLHETLAFLYQQNASFQAFERWLLDKNGGAIDAVRVARINAALQGEPVPAGDIDPPVLSDADLTLWNERGYVVLHDAVPPDQRASAVSAICAYLGADLGDPETWYHRTRHSIWVPLLHHPALWAIRRSPRIRSAFAQLWGRCDLWESVDQAGFNPPERPDWPFPGPHLHWDAELVPPVAFNVQGILYLTDTAADQGAFTCVPGFHHRLDAWLRTLPAGTDPQKQDLRALGPVAIPGRAGDLIIWNSALPHGASPNRSDRPRIVQYVQMRPSPEPAPRA